MRVCVVGCGAVGGLFAAHLGNLDDVEVFAYDLFREHVDAINRSGLRLTGKADLLARVTATDDATTLPPCDFGIVATKSYATRSAIEAAAVCFGGSASVCSVQNGVGNEEVLADYVGRVIRGTTFHAGHVVSPGVIEMDTTGDTWIGPFEGRPAPMDEVQRLGRLCEVEEVRRLVSGLVAEGVAVAEALGITLDSDPEELIDHAARVAYDHRASMLQDVQARRRTEIDVLNAGIAAFGAQTGVPTPIDDVIVALIRGVERSFELEAPNGEPPL